MELTRYLREILNSGQSYSCNDYSCSLPINNDKQKDFSIPVSKYNIPFDFVEINKGSIVVNIISNLGYEISKESEKTGINGKVIGIDFSPAMMYKARYNVEKTGCRNVVFREVFSSRFLPLGPNISDILIFNKLLNYLTFENLFSEIYRTLKPGGVFYIYDSQDHVNTDVNLKNDYIRKLDMLGFKNIIIKEFVKDELIKPVDNDSNFKKLRTVLIKGEK
ncbi:MAG: methyltransferase domain-containing protein [Prevotellaceae bacterium]|jgi:SAM-dependent methyltransferase|nr:methyltransferase domain-containing protein [Prevotellaceae bacterium]